MEVEEGQAEVRVREDRCVVVRCEWADDIGPPISIELRPGADESRVRLTPPGGLHEVETTLTALRRALALVEKEHQR